MFEVIEKQEHWAWLDAGLSSPLDGELRAVGDLYILHQLKDVSGLRILEVGGGSSRVLPRLAAENECWNADRSVESDPVAAGVEQVKCHLGEFCAGLPSAYFDYVFSISVLQHVADDDLEPFFLDCGRALKPGGESLHVFETYLFDATERAFGAGVKKRLERYLEVVSRSDLGLQLRRPPGIDKDLCYSSRFVTNSDATLYRRSKANHELRPVRESAQNVALKMEWIKPRA